MKKFRVFITYREVESMKNFIKTYWKTLLFFSLQICFVMVKLTIRGDMYGQEIFIIKRNRRITEIKDS